MLKASKLGQWAPDVLRGFVQTIFQDSPNLRFATPYGPMEMSAGEFFTQPAEVQEALKGSVIDPTSPGPQQGLEVSQQESDGGGLEQVSDAPAQVAPETVAALGGQTVAEGSPQLEADSDDMDEVEETEETPADANASPPLAVPGEQEVELRKGTIQGIEDAEEGVSNILQKNLRPDVMALADKELKGGPGVYKKDGSLFDHPLEVEQGVGGMKGVIKRINRLLKIKSITGEYRERLEAAKELAQKSIEAGESILNQPDQRKP